MQGTAEWHALRCGRVTASRLADVLGTPTARRNYWLEILWERDTGQPKPAASSAALEWGHAQEPNARAAYEFAAGVDVEEVDFIVHPEFDWLGGSPDGLVGDGGIIEIKSPYNGANHLETVLSGMPKKHMPQVQGLLWITGRDWCDFISYHPDYSPMPCYIERVSRDDGYIAEMEQKAREFWEHVTKRRVPK